jgi:Transglycosylase SLT domain
MALRTKKKAKVVSVKEHARKVSVSIKNPKGLTIVDKHSRHIDGKFLDQEMIENIFKKYEKKGIVYPASGKIEFPNADKFDELIAVWCDYFNRKLTLKPQIDPNMVKALVATESGFNPLAKNKIAQGLTQITKDTLEIIQDPGGEAKDFAFKGIKRKDLNDPNISMALGIRWLAQKQKLAFSKLKRAPTSDEVVMMYKGVLKDKSTRADKIMNDYRYFYEKLKK